MAGLFTPVAAQPAIAGALPWGGGSAGAISGAAHGDVNAIASSYQSAYNNALAMNQSNYNNILAGYQSAMNTQTTAQDAIRAGYTDLYNRVLGKIDSIGTARTNAINNAAARQQGLQDQQLINRGLGNTTVQASVNRGIQGDRQQALTQLADDQARLSGDFMSQLGLAGLNNQQRGLENQTALTQSQLAWMNSLNAKYPDAGFYGSLAQTAAQTAAQTNAMNRFGGGAFGGGPPVSGGVGKIGYVPSPGPDYGSGQGVQPGFPSGGGGGFGNLPPGLDLNNLGGGGVYGGSYGGGTNDPVMRGWDMPPGSGDAGAGLGSPYPAFGGGTDPSVYGEAAASFGQDFFGSEDY